jgi:hypothetical protein
MLIAYLTTDDLNLALARQIADDHGATLFPLSFQDAPPDHRFDAVLYDWDYLPTDKRQEIQGDLLAANLPCPVALHSYHLAKKQAKALRQNGVIVAHRLDPDLFLLVRRAAERRRRRHLSYPGTSSGVV